MLDGRVLGASQVEYKPFGKPPLKREVEESSNQKNGGINTQGGTALLKVKPMLIVTLPEYCTMNRQRRNLRPRGA